MQVNVSTHAIESYAHAITLEAYRISKNLGFGYIGCVDSPTCLSDMTHAVDTSRRFSLAYPVDSAYCVESILGSIGRPDANEALRFVHDIQHVAMQRGTSFGDEIWLGDYLADELTMKYGRIVGDLARLDMVGSAAYQKRHGAYPTGSDLLASAA